MKKKDKPIFVESHQEEFREEWYREMAKSYSPKNDKTKLTSLDYYKWYNLENDELVETDPTCFKKEDLVVYITTTPTTPTNLEVQIWKNDRLYWNDWGMKAIELIQVPQYLEHILRKINE